MNNPVIYRPPKHALRFFQWFCRPELVEQIEGDLFERFQGEVEETSLRAARRSYWWQVLLLFRPGIIRSVHSTSLTNVAMWKHNFISSWRNFKRNLGYGTINIFGLAIGLACVMLIAVFVKFEQSYDTFHENYDRMYRIAKEDPGSYYLGTNQFAVTPAPLVKALPDEFPEVEHATQIRKEEGLFAVGESKAYEDGIYATQDFFHVFTFPFLQGNAESLAEPNSIVLTKSLAKKYFRNEDPIGTHITVDIDSKPTELQIVGVINDIPKNSHLQFDYVISMKTSQNYLGNIDHWDNNNYLTYAVLRADHDVLSFSEKLIPFAREKLLQYEYYQDNPESISIYFPQAIGGIHLRSKINFEFGTNGDLRYVRLFSAVALLILLIACINFVNLSTAKAGLRGQEIGVRKMIGAHRAQLIAQLMGEAMLPAVLATIAALLITFAALPLLNQLTDRSIDQGFLMEENLLPSFLLVGLGVGLLAGLYPAAQISRMQSGSKTDGSRLGAYSSSRLRNGLVVLQFAITVPLIIGAIVIQRQLQFIHDSDSGVDRDYVVTIRLQDDDVVNQYSALKQSLSGHPGIKAVTAAASLPISIRSQSGTREWEGSEAIDRISVYHSAVQSEYVALLDLEVVAGKDFSAGEYIGERKEMLINETLARQIGWEDPIGKWFNLNGKEGRVIGVLKDFNFLSYELPMAPLALYRGTQNLSQLMVKVEPSEIQAAIAHIKVTMQEFSPKSPFEFRFLDDANNQMYANVVRLGGLFKYFTGLALLLACLGLFGLAAFIASQRTKEIGIRKVLGANAIGILVLLSKDFVRLILLGYLIAIPVAWYAMNQWLEDFAFRIELSWWTFLMAGFMVLTVAMLAVSSQSMRAALTDPVKAIKQE